MARKIICDRCFRELPKEATMQQNKVPLLLPMYVDDQSFKMGGNFSDMQREKTLKFKETDLCDECLSSLAEWNTPGKERAQ